MDCLAEIIGLKGGCEDISTASEIYLDTKVKYSELEKYVDQNDVATNTVAKLFSSLRSQAAIELIDEINAHMASGYIAKTVVKSSFIGDAGTTLNDSLQSAVLKGVRLTQSSSYPSYAYRISRVGFIGNYTGNVAVLYYDGLTGQLLATDTIAAVANTRVEVDVNRQFRSEIISIVYDATVIDGYKTTLKGSGTCLNCRDANKVNGYCTGQAITATIGTPLTYSTTNEMGGLSVSLAIECDHQSWICRLKQQLGVAMLYKTAELCMEYALNNTERENTETIRDYELIGNRQQQYHEQYSDSITRALKAVKLPQDPNCFHCNRRNRIAVSIP